MYAIVEILGFQYKIFENKFIYIPHIEYEKGKNIFFKNVLFFEKENRVIFGTPFIKGIEVKGKILEHLKSDKIIVFKKKKRKGYKIKQGHRQLITKLEILSIKNN